METLNTLHGIQQNTGFNKINRSLDLSEASEKSRGKLKDPIILP
jgi:hypothetical protein